MARSWERVLQRWVDASLIDLGAADRIRGFEAARDEKRGRRWPVVLAWCIGGVLLAAGILLFVAAHWDRLSAGSRLTLVLLLVALFHVAAAFLSEYSNVLARVLHAVGTVSLGAGIFLTGQIFHLQEHWPGGVMLWAIGSWVGWYLLRDWLQLGLAAALTPAWLAGEWIEATLYFDGAEWPYWAGLWLLSLTYFTAVTPASDSAIRRTLMWLGGLTLIPFTFVLCDIPSFSWQSKGPLPAGLSAAGWVLAIALPAALAWILRKRTSWLFLVAAVWVLLLRSTAALKDSESYLAIGWHELGPYGLCGMASILLVVWGFSEGRRERINMGVAGFGLTVITFYFATVMDKLGRSVSLIGMGVLFLVGGWILEKSRRRLIAKMSEHKT